VRGAGGVADLGAVDCGTEVDMDALRVLAEAAGAGHRRLCSELGLSHDEDVGVLVDLAYGAIKLANVSATIW
jgi:hypothetical protein